MSDSSGGSKRQALRFTVDGYELRYKTEFEDGRATLLNISAGGCALIDLSVAVNLHEKILLILDCGNESPVEVGGMSVRVVPGRETAIRFLQQSEESRQAMVKYFARVQRMQRSEAST